MNCKMNVKVKIIKSISKAIIASALLIGINLQAHAEMTNYFVISDHLGTPEMLVDKDQRVVWKAEYDEFGKATILVEEVEFNLRLPGQYYDKETGTHYNYYRNYNPELGGYVQPDPIGILRNFNDPQMQVADRLGIPLRSAGNGSGLNQIYGFVGNNPILLTDYFGLSNNPSDNAVWPASMDCSCTQNCMKDPDAGGWAICDAIPGKNPKIGDCEIPIDLPKKACEIVTKSFSCANKCESFCTGKTKNSPFPDK